MVLCNLASDSAKDLKKGRAKEKQIYRSGGNTIIEISLQRICFKLLFNLM